jgi:transposase
VIAQRTAFHCDISKIPWKKLVFIDEAGSNLSMSREYAWAPNGERANDAKPYNWGDNVTMIGALTLKGILTMMTVNGGTSGEVFLAFVKQFLVPKLRKGNLVIMDNLSAHKVDGVDELIESAGARVWYLPPYSPDFNPIEHCWSKIKSILRAVKARSRIALDRAIANAMKLITLKDIRGWFGHCLLR